MAREKKSQQKVVQPTQSGVPWIRVAMIASGIIAVIALAIGQSGEILGPRFARSPIDVGRRALPTNVPAASTAQPSAWPSADQKNPINGVYLNDPIVQNALAYVQSVADPATLAIPPSTYINGAKVNYSADPSQTCYWPSNGCTRSSAGNWGPPDIVYCDKPGQWGLTFDDGPSYNIVNGSHYNDSRVLLNQLNSMNIKATFFIIGGYVTYWPAELQALASSGMQIAGHSWTHHPTTSLTNAQIVAEVMYTQAFIYKTTGLLPRYFRPPYGDIDDRARAIINALGFRIVVWDGNYDSLDSDGVTYDVALARIHSWFGIDQPIISLQHTLSGFTAGIAIQALKDIVAMGGISNQIMPVAQCLDDTLWYYGKPVTTWYNTCTQSSCPPPLGYSGHQASPGASPGTTQAAATQAVAGLLQVASDGYTRNEHEAIATAVMAVLLVCGMASM
ncbi:hypothetical protein SmJEL517_g04894 [Synchytrium microbalum]|uniref:NodB homology domain-containing protein n=1 Tax=Synchytrium microbalum TaxID=1806994 RepID=A0A507BXK6_9FUNG|nr:uncharacterized protein SmJEL517_g04894 [Synchytrium microbalum]TPX31831.1 hypothetical protein SmJEL517_g04894 [Synchytrium microbalum]